MAEQPTPTAQTSAGPPNRPPTASPPVEAAGPDPRIEDYLDHVCVPLVGLVPYAHRQELRAELHSHLEALAATHEELGSGREAAVLLALRQFGPPRSLARQWAREWVRSTAPERVLPAWRAMGVALGSFGAATLVAMGILTVLRAIASPFVDPILVLAGVVGIAGMLLPALAGFATGLLAPARAVLGTFYALSILIAPTALLAFHALPRPGAEHALSVGLAFVQPLLWIPIGCITAAVGGALRDRWSLQPRGWVLQ